MVARGQMGMGKDGQVTGVLPAAGFILSDAVFAVDECDHEGDVIGGHGANDIRGMV